MEDYPKGYEIFIMQLKSSKSVLAVFVLLTIASLFLRYRIDWFLLDALLIGALYFLTMFVGFAVGTAVHETEHFNVLKRFKIPVTNVVAHRIANVSFHIDCSDEISLEEAYEISAASFRGWKQRIIETVILAILVTLNMLIPFPFNLVLAFLTFLVALQFLGGICGCYLVESQKTEGLCVSLAKTRSGEDIEDIIRWNKELVDTK
ncbi:MAG: hypothetical protein GF309_11165 [Candidatus Lokiarchaeota archaeon]|nr:hypothetical protein [Candidatus Lokiarchaeota archaeon]